MSGGVALGPHLGRSKSSGRSILVAYVTGGICEDWTDYLAAMVDGGADAVEVGIPFSDPVMDGPTIQEASTRALASGASPGSVLDAVRRLEIPVPLVAMTYCNVVWRAGEERFARMAADSGITGAIVPDAPLEESRAWEEAAAGAGVDAVLLAAPITPDDRLSEICRRSNGFVYGVNLMGVTGERPSVGESAGTLAARLTQATDLPVIMGFGISTPAVAVEVASHADGVVVASALVRRILDGDKPADIERQVHGFREALDESP